MKRVTDRVLAVFLSVGIVFGMPVPEAEGAAASKPRVTKKLTLEEGNTGKIRVSGKYVKSVSYKPEKKKIVSVDARGTVKAKKAGKCRVWVTVKYKKKKSAKNTVAKKYTCRVVVKKKKKVPVPAYEPGSEFTKQTADFSVRLLQNAAGAKVAKGKNALLSPESVICALAMTANGAGGNTLAEFEKVLCGNVGRDEYNHTLYALNANLTSSENVKFNLANSIWLKKGFHAKKDFIRKNQSLFDAEVREVPFNDKTLKEINGWVKEKTNGMIKKILDRVSPDTVAALINSLAFEGRWSSPYREYNIRKNQIFTDAGGNEDKAVMLCGTESSYMEDDKAAGFVKYYQGGEFAFMAVRPNDGVTVSDYLRDLTGEKFLNLYNMSKTSNNIIVHTMMPEFSYDDSVELRNPLRTMGIQDAFSRDRADFTNMIRENAYISNVLHKTHIELDRNGTKAAAVTAVVAKATSAMPDPNRVEKTVNLDKPFLYAIVEAKTGFPVFLGVVNDLK